MPPAANNKRGTLWIAPLRPLPSAISWTICAPPRSSRLRGAALQAGATPVPPIRARIDRWALDEVPLPGRLTAEIAQLLYREDRFHRGSLTVGGRPLGPSELKRPTLAVVDSADEIAPLASVKPFLDAMTIGTALIEYPGETGVGLQHLALLAGPRAHAEVWPKIFSWLRSID